MGSGLTSVGDGDFKREVLESTVPVLVEFWATWCPPCRAMVPDLEALAQRYKGTFELRAMNVDDYRLTPEQYGIRAVPTLLLFKAGRVVQQWVGAVPRSKLEGTLLPLLERR